MSSVFLNDAEIVVIGSGMFDRTLPKGRWTHAAHFASAVWVLVKRRELVAEVAMPAAIRAYNEATGVANTATGGYHETITIASIRAARAFVASRGGSAMFETCNALLESKLGHPSWLLEYWSCDVLFSMEARARWVEPDVAVLPF